MEEGKGGTEAVREVPHGQRECENCVFCHPEREKRPCSVFRELQNRDKDCSAYIDRRE